VSRLRVGKTDWLTAFIVTVIICIVAWLTMPIWLRVPRYHYPRSLPLSNIKQVCLAAIMYSADYDDTLPLRMSSNDDLLSSLLPYAMNEEIFKSVNPSGSTILGNDLLEGVDTTTVNRPFEVVMIYESRDWAERDGRNVGYVDGHAKFIQYFDHRMLDVDFVESGK